MAKWFDGTLVKLLTGAHFQDQEPWNLKNKRCAFILFFADWCGHCRDLKPEYIKFADTALFMRVHAIDTESESSLMKRFDDKSPIQIEGFPTIYIYRDGKPYKEYKGPRTWQGMLAEAKKVCSEGCKCDKKPRRRVRTVKK
uniref:Thioredoxin n=1 Tax=Marseillevirus LCMAC201 TaxID=2506605 RepID=A0A481YW32_9VIRU|nr:MAG: thioredoxin [Marseillevirus LCMAC201]